MRRVAICIAGAAMLLPIASYGQSPAKGAGPAMRAPRDPLPRFTIAPRGGSLPAIGLPLPPHGLQPPPSNALYRHYRYPTYFTYPYWPMFYYPPLVVEAPPAPEPAPEPVQPAPGRLFLEVYPAGAQIYADGYYVGTAEDFGAERGGGLMEAGTHRLDIIASGHDSLAIDVKVTPRQTITYRATLIALPPPAAVPPSTFYLIPGCYMGNIPPKDAHLPPTCDTSRATIWRP